MISERDITLRGEDLASSIGEVSHEVHRASRQIIHVASQPRNGRIKGVERVRDHESRGVPVRKRRNGGAVGRSALDPRQFLPFHGIGSPGRTRIEGIRSGAGSGVIIGSAVSGIRILINDAPGAMKVRFVVLRLIQARHACR